MKKNSLEIYLLLCRMSRHSTANDEILLQPPGIVTDDCVPEENLNAWKRHKIYPDFIVSDKEAPTKHDYCPSRSLPHSSLPASDFIHIEHNLFDLYNKTIACS